MNLNDIQNFIKSLENLSDKEVDIITKEFSLLMKSQGRCTQCQFPYHDGICSCEGSPLFRSVNDRIIGNLVSYLFCENYSKERK